MIFISNTGQEMILGAGGEKGLQRFDEWKRGITEFIIQTSGSTGKPKKIILSRDAIRASVSMTQKVFGLQPDNLFFCCLNPDYIAGMMMIFRAAELEAEIVITEPESNPFSAIREHWHLFLDNWGKNFFAFVPLQLRQLLAADEYIQLLRTAQAILVGGAAVSKDLVEIIQKHHLPVFETYGMTETISHIAIRDLREDKPFFTVLDEVNIKTDSDNCLIIKAPSTLNQWITTNDVVELIDEHHFILKGRRDNIINSGGIKIHPEEIEQLIAESHTVKQNFFLFGLQDEVLGQKMVLFAEGEESSFTKAIEALPKYKKPKEVIILNQFLKTESGKTDRKNTVKQLYLCKK